VPNELKEVTAFGIDKGLITGKAIIEFTILTIE
jgi:hypothetical protein